MFEIWCLEFSMNFSSHFDYNIGEIQNVFSKFLFLKTEVVNSLYKVSQCLIFNTYFRFSKKNTFQVIQLTFTLQVLVTCSSNCDNRKICLKNEFIINIYALSIQSPIIFHDENIFCIVLQFLKYKG